MPEPTTKLPRRDFVLLPLLSLLTCVVLFALAEVGARTWWPENEEDSCVVADAKLGFRFKPNCQSLSKAMEGPWVTNNYNSCGYRTDQGCGVRPNDVLRIDLMGSSTAEGYLIPYEHTVGATLQSDLHRACSRTVQVENMGMIGYQGDIIVEQMDEALALKPNAIVFLVTPFDFDYVEKVPAGSAPPVQHIELLRRVRNYLAASRAAELAQHFAFNDSRRFANLYLTYGDRADFMRPPFTAAWRERLAKLDDQLGKMQAKAAAAGVKLVLTYVPSRAQAIFLADDHPQSNVDGFAFGRAIGDIARKHDVPYLDTSEMFSHLHDAGALFYPHNGHLTAEGQPLVGDSIARSIVNDAAPFHGCLQPTRTEAAADAPDQGGASR
jgi:hypothetical protein